MLINSGKYKIGNNESVYFIADISANHDGELKRAIDLINQAAEAGAQAAKFQNFRASEIVSNVGFEKIGKQMSHQLNWDKPVYEIYRNASLPWGWTEDLKKECDKVGLDFFSTPYDLESVDMLEPYVQLYKIGSGDITWHEMLIKVANKNKPILLATGASSIGDVQKAVDVITNFNNKLVLMQCNTNYTGSISNFKHINLNVLNTFRILFPDVIMGLSDHTPGHTTVLGAVSLGAKVIEKHFTDDTKRKGPDHPFSMDPRAWSEMVARTRELEYALGSTFKKVEENEKETIIVQRRCLYAGRRIEKGSEITRDMITVLRPAFEDGIFPNELNMVLGKILAKTVETSEYLKWSMFDY